MNQKSYAGIGSRQIPDDILPDIKDVVDLSHQLGYTLNSGGAVGADAAFERAAITCNAPRNIFLPWPGFNGLTSPYTKPKEQAFELAAGVHPAWPRVRVAARKLVARNMHQILGWSLKDPVSYVVCWTPDGCETRAAYSKNTGGTGSAIALADLNGIPVFNLYNPGRFEEWIDFMKRENNVYSK